MNNKFKQIGFLAVSLVVFLLVSSCATVGGGMRVWDDTIPAGNSATVRFNNMAIDSYNGISVTRFNHVQIPAGEATFSGLVVIYHAGITWRANGMIFTCNFEAGKNYIVQGSTENRLWGVTVYNSTVRPENKVVFVPFKEQPVFH